MGDKLQYRTNVS